MASSEHGRTLFACRSNKPTATTRFGSKKICPYNSEFTANPEHGRTLFAPTDVTDSFFCRKIATLGTCAHL
ncbi:hypothetical protein, partial [Ruminococcus sp.]|uniref:hypothetical protein n=1 Tax=Ruminococcus sp. TaxID=41978 RepID=UPI003FEF3764